MLIGPALLRRWALPRPDGEMGKERRGCVLVVGGSREIPGAVILAATAALRAGAGKLQMATAQQVAPLVAVTVPEARVIGVAQTAAGELQRRAWRALRPLAAACDALLVGPGMSDAAAAAAIELVAIVRRQPRPTVILDAGGLGALAGRDAFARRRRATVVATPHAGEMATLWGVTRDEVLARPAQLAVEAARTLGITLVLKGARTHVALHARAGEVLARKVGELGFLARELLAELPSLMSRLARQPPARARHSR